MRIGLLSGDGIIVNIVIKKLLEDNHEPFIISMVNRDYPSNIKRVQMNHANIEFLLEILQKNKISHIALVGKIDKNRILKDLSISNLKSYLNTEKGDIDLLKGLEYILNSYNIQFLNLQRYLQGYITEEKLYTNQPLTDQEKEDIYFGAQKIKTLANLEIGQTIIVKDKLVYSVEAIEGTNEVIRRTSKYGIDEGILVKVGRDKQNFIYEIPAIGFETIMLASKFNIKVIALESGSTLFLEQEKSISLANKKGLKIAGFSMGKIK